MGGGRLMVWWCCLLYTHTHTSIRLDPPKSYPFFPAIFPSFLTLNGYSFSSFFAFRHLIRLFYSPTTKRDFVDDSKSLFHPLEFFFFLDWLSWISFILKPSPRCGSTYYFRFIHACRRSQQYSKLHYFKRLYEIDILLVYLHGYNIGSAFKNSRPTGSIFICGI